MATGEQIKSLVKAHVESNEDRFKTVVLQIAAHEAKLGHDKIARELKMLIEKNEKKSPSILHLHTTIPFLEMVFPTSRFADLVVEEELECRIRRILDEYRNRKKLHNFGLKHRRKVLIEGCPGTGKTMTASVIAFELNLPLYIVQMDKLITKFMGETSVKLRQVFDVIGTTPGVYFFDEFDAIGSDRSLDNEVGEMRRILNSFLQFLEQDNSDAIILAATNNLKLLDRALFRRFDDILHYSFPSENEIERLISKKMSLFDEKFTVSLSLIEAAKGLSHAEIARVCEDAIKDSILNEEMLSTKKIAGLLQERQTIYEKRGEAK